MRAPARPLSAAERRLYAPYFAPEVIDAALVHDARVPIWLRSDMCGVTLGSRIYFRPGAYDPASTNGIELLAHELAHVQQYREGMTLLRYAWASRFGYRRNRYEIEARAVGARVRAEVCGTPFARGQPAASPSTCRASASATSMPSTPADMIPPA